ncbi:hypothetical protein MRX96_041510 [Rhipicephalus microplus]
MSSRSPSPRAGRRPAFLSQPSVISWQSDPTRPPQYLILNPMHIVNLTADKTKSCAVRAAQSIKAFSQRWFSHILLLLVLLAYAAMGAALFQLIEGPFEDKQKQTILNARQYIIEDLVLAQRTLSVAGFRRHALRRLREFETQVRVLEDEARIRHPTYIPDVAGYGNIAPSTMGGMAVTILYAFIGIPLLLMVLADLGKVFTRGIKWLFLSLRQLVRTGRCGKHKAKAPPPQLQYVAFVWRKVNDTMAYVPYPAYLKQEPTTPTAEEGGEEASKAASEEELVIDDQFNLPVSLALLLLSIYMTVGACIFTIWEEWSFFEAFYFVFISMSTIGFGDYVPDHPMFMMATFIYLLFGLALTSMCINVVQEKLSAIFERARMQLGTTIGFDAMVIDQERKEPLESDIDEAVTKDAIAKEAIAKGLAAQEAAAKNAVDKKVVSNDVTTKNKTQHKEPT